MCVCSLYMCDVSIMTQIIKRPGEGITATNGAGRVFEGASDLYRAIWKLIKKCTNKKVVRGSPTLSAVAQRCQRSPNSDTSTAQLCQ